MGKKLIFSILVAFLFSGVVSAEINVEIDSKKVDFEDAEPIIIKDRTYLPARKIFETLGAYVEWDGENKKVFAHKRLADICMTVGEDEYILNSEYFPMCAPPILIDDRVMLPLRDAANALGVEVTWDETTKTVYMTSKKSMREIKDCYLEFWDKTTGKNKVTGVVSYPQIISDDNICQAFNEFMEVNSKEYADEIIANYSKNAQNNNKNFVIDKSFDITYDDSSMICILWEEEIYQDSTFISIKRTSATYDMNTGKSVEIEEIMNTDFAKIRKAVKEKFIELINESPQDFYEDAVAVINSDEFKLNYYLAQDGVHFFVNPAVIAPISYGFLEVII